MNCLKCGGRRVRIIHTKTHPEPDRLIRRCECRGCGHHFSTVELLLVEYQDVVERARRMDRGLRRHPPAIRGGLGALESFLKG